MNAVALPLHRFHRECRIGGSARNFDQESHSRGNRLATLVRLLRAYVQPYPRVDILSSRSFLGRGLKARRVSTRGGALARGGKLGWISESIVRVVVPSSFDVDEIIGSKAREHAQLRSRSPSVPSRDPAEDYLRIRKMVNSLSPLLTKRSHGVSFARGSIAARIIPSTLSMLDRERSFPRVRVERG